MKRNHLHAIRTGGACAALVVAVGLVFACSEAPTEATMDDLAPQFAKGGIHGPPDSGDDPNSTTVTFELLTLSEPPGVYADNKGSYEALRQDCLAGRSITLVPPVDGMGDPVMPDGVPLPAVCGTENESGRVSIHLPGDELDPALDGDDYGADEPSFTTNKKGKVRPTGWMRPTFNLVWACGDLEFCNFVWTDGEKTTTGPEGNRVATITGSCARLYAGGLNTVPFEPTSGCDAGFRIIEEDEPPVSVLGFEVAIIVTVTEETTQ